MRRCPEFVLLLMHVFHSAAYGYAVGSIRQIAGKGTRGLRTPRTVNTKHAQLYSSRRPRDDYFPIGDYDTFDGRSFASSDEEVEVKNAVGEDYYYYDDDVKDGDRYFPSKQNYDLYDEELQSDDLEGEGVPGNFWSNPKNGMDPVVESSASRSPRPRELRPLSTAASHERRYRVGQAGQKASEGRRPRRRTSFRSGTPSAPPVAKSFYERLFWYGFDPDESDGVGDKTVFGGTKGKFNGLSFLYDAEGAKPTNQRSPRGLPPAGTIDYDDFYDLEEGAEYYDEAGNDQSDKVSQSRSLKPPSDLPYPRSEAQEPQARQSPSRPSRRGDYYKRADDEEAYGLRQRGRSTSASKQVSSWFSSDGEDTDDDLGNTNFEPRGRRGNQESEWSPFNVLNVFFGVDRDQMKGQADEYNAKMGIGEARSRRRKLERASPRRPGYTYRYNDGDYEPLAADVDISAKAFQNDTNVASIASKDRRQLEEEHGRKSRRVERSWEERALAVEQVPPSSIPAWGPSGGLGIDSRSKAVLDAIEDIQTARQKLEVKEKKEVLAREDITILRVDAELQRRQLAESRQSARFAQERLRQIELDVDDASRALRRARSQVQLARQSLEALEDRHWALLSIYNPDQAEEKVTEALNEFQELEPAARLDDFEQKMDAAKPIEYAASDDDSAGA